MYDKTKIKMWPCRIVKQYKIHKTHNDRECVIQISYANLKMSPGVCLSMLTVLIHNDKNEVPKNEVTQKMKCQKTKWHRKWSAKKRSDTENEVPKNEVTQKMKCQKTKWHRFFLSWQWQYCLGIIIII